MSGFSGAASWAGKNPVLLGVGVFAVGAVLLLLLRKPTVIQDSGMGAFYAAQAAGNNSGNQLAAVQAQVAGATAIAGIAASRDTTLADIGGRYSIEANTVRAQLDRDLAGLNQEVALAQERTRVEAQNKAYWQGVGQNALQGQSLPYLLQALMNPSTSTQAAAVMKAQIEGASQYYAAR